MKNEIPNMINKMIIRLLVLLVNSAGFSGLIKPQKVLQQITNNKVNECFAEDVRYAFQFGDFDEFDNKFIENTKIG